MLLQQYEEDYDILTTPFGLRGSLKTEAVLPESRVSQSSNMSDIFAEVPKGGNESVSLKIAFILGLVFFLVEFFLMF